MIRVRRREDIAFKSGDLNEQFVQNEQIVQKEQIGQNKQIYESDS